MDGVCFTVDTLTVVVLYSVDVDVTDRPQQKRRIIKQHWKKRSTGFGVLLDHLAHRKKLDINAYQAWLW